MKKFVFFFLVLLLGWSSNVSAAVTYCTSSAVGYGENATGGGNATPVLVSSVSQLQSALKGAKNKVIIITQDLTFTSLMSVSGLDGVTLLGLPGVTLTSLEQTTSTSGILKINKSSNVIIRNLTFVGPGAYDCDGSDNLCFESVTNAWVDHCDFQDGCDGNFDNKKLSDKVTVSWCRFRYLKKPKSGGSGGAADHRFTNLLGSSSSDKPSDGIFNYTWAYCWWDEGCKERMVRCRNCELHFLNCYWNSSVANYYVGPENAKCYFDGCTFEGKANTSAKIFKSYGGTNACKFVDCSGNLPSNSGTVNKPTYTYTASGQAEAKTAVTNASCGAGATLNVTTAGVVSSSCDAGETPTIYTVTWNATQNGGTCGTASSSISAGQAIGSLPEATKTDATFKGWFTAATGGTQISSSTKVTGNVTYFAQFTTAAVTTYYTVIWDANGGTCSTASSTIESGKTVGTLPTATKTGDYTFDGWYTAINGGTQITTSTVISANVTYYAHYTATGGGGGGSCSGTIFSLAGWSTSNTSDWSGTSNTSTQITGLGTLTGGDAYAVSIQDGKTCATNGSGDNMEYKLGYNAVALRCKLDCALAEGDVITITYGTSSANAFIITNTNSRSSYVTTDTENATTKT
ncbi:MAG: InlB B-repeat-containing protein, partial [Elusimicrobiaceae bacterium]|nr:InlB B-repeat-containing protein [Elusimicrobiaceae bacterium]